MHKISIGLLFIIMNNAVIAQGIITDRPDQTESSSTVSKGSLQIETGILIAYTDNDEFSEEQILAPTTLFRYGIIKGLELRVLNQFEKVKDKTTSDKINGISDLEIGFKAQLLKNEDINTEIAFLSHLIVPTGTEGLTNDDFGSINKLSISHEINNNIGLGYNVGYNYYGVESGDLTYSIAIGIGVTEKIGIYVEPYGEVINFDTHEASFDAGITYLLKSNMQFDFSFGTGINHTMNYMSIGFSVNFAKKED